MTPPTDLIITDRLLQRPERAPNPQVEQQALHELSQILADDPHRTVRRFMQIALRLCDAGSAGLSRLRPTDSGQTDFVWETIAGAMAPHEGGATPRSFSPCGLCLDAGAMVLLSRPEREFTYLQRLQPVMFEVLIVPLYDDARRPLGALWIAHHDPVARFRISDARTMEQLATRIVPVLTSAEPATTTRCQPSIQP